MAMNNNQPSWGRDSERGGNRGAAREEGLNVERDEETEELLPCGRALALLWEAWDNYELDTDPHVAECQYCTAALERLQVLQDFVGEAEDSDPGEGINDDGSEDERWASRVDSVTARVMDIVRLELRPGRTLPLGEPDEDSWIVEAALAKVLRRAAETLPGVRAGSCQVRPSATQDEAAADTADMRAESRNAGSSAATALATGSAETSEEGGEFVGRETEARTAAEVAEAFERQVVVIPGRGPVDVYLEVAATMSWTLPDLAENVRERLMDAAHEAVGIDVRAIDVSVVDLLDDGLAEVAGGTEGDSERRYQR
ncbi:hypothetical protein [Streptomyces sp. DW26H14]|uniref:hypothetical protein n=1 Tax=Streptomyces sp. DW26H14 TaxID=3435395 RepID=UPI00403D903A